MEKPIDYNEALMLIIDEFDGAISDVQQIQLQQWRSVSTDNERIYKEFYALNVEIEALAHLKQLDLDASWKRLEEDLADRNIVTFREAPPVQKSPGKWKQILSIAATILAVLGVYYYLQASSVEIVQTAKGGHKRISLPDGSWLAMNEETIVEFNKKDFASNRKLRLVKGEAFFEIKHDVSHPFKVQAAEATIEDLGTSFTVTNSEDEVNVVVSSGKVAFSAASAGNPQVILPQQIASYNFSNKKIQVADAALSGHDLSWINQQLFFNNASLSSVIKALDECYDVKISLSDKSLESRKLTANLAFRTVDSALEVISASMQLKVRKNDEGYLLSR